MHFGSRECSASNLAAVRVVVIVPTYNEVENVEAFLRAVRTAAPEVEIYLADDASPDGTGAVADRVAAELGRITVLHRPGKRGLGTAYRDAMSRVLPTNPDVVMMMDADFSHDPAAIPRFLEAIRAGADVVIGSRYVPGGRTVNWPWYRRWLSRWGNRYTSLMLRLPVADSTTGFRAFRTEALRRMDILGTVSEGYSFTSEGILRAVHRGVGRIVEIPIVFEDRKWGTSKMNSRIIAESMLRVTRWGLALRLRRRAA
jgi:dolichol-phosphate mannosyltransferase